MVHQVGSIYKILCRIVPGHNTQTHTHTKTYMCTYGRKSH